MSRLLDERSEKQRYVWAAVAAYLGSYSLGAALGYSSPVQAQLMKEMPNLDESLFGSILTIGALVGGLLSSILAERCGRKGTILGTSLLFAAGWMLIIMRFSVLTMYVARVLLGLGSGIYCMVVPVYIGEISVPEKRGIFGAGHQFDIVLGILMSYVFGAFLDATDLALVCLAPVTLCVLAMVFMPESPAWLVKKQKSKQDVMRALYFLYGHTVRAESQYELLIDAKNDDDFNDFTAVDLLDSSVLKPLGITFGLMLLQQGCGINAVIFYTDKIFKSAGTTMNSSLETIIVGAVQVVFTVPAALLMDRAGRRMLLHISGGFSLLGLSLLVVFYYLKEHSPNSVHSLSWLPTAALSIFVAGYAFGLGPIAWLMMSELLPMRARGIGTGLCTSFNWLVAFCVTKFFPKMMTQFGEAGSYGVFASVVALGLVFVFFFVPETKGKTLEEIEAMFKKQSLEESVSTVDGYDGAIN